MEDIRLKIQPGNGLCHGADEEGVLFALRHPAEVDAVAEIELVVDQVDHDPVKHEPLQPDVLVPPAEVNVKVSHVGDALRVFVFDDAVVGNDDARVDAERAKTLRQGADHVGQTAGFGQRRAFRRGQQHARQRVAAFFAKRGSQFLFHRNASFQRAVKVK